MTNEISSYSAAVTIFATMLGFGILCTPKAAAGIGWLNTILLVFIVGLLSFFSFLLIFESCKNFEKLNIDETENLNNLEELKINNPKNECELEKIEIQGFSTLLFNSNKYIRKISEICIFLGSFTANIAYTKTLVNFVINIINTTKEYDILINVLISLFHFLLTFKKDISFLGKISFLSSIATLGVSSTLFLYLSQYDQKYDVDMLNYNFEKALGTFIFTFSCQSVIPNIYNSLENKKQTTLISLISSFMGIASVLFFAIPGYLISGHEILNNSASDILNFLSAGETTFSNFLENSFDKNGIAIKFCNVLFFIVLNISYRLQSFVGINSLIGLNKPSKSKLRNFFSETFISFLYIGISSLLSVFDGTNDVVNFSGTYILSFTSFILPIICYFSTRISRNRCFEFMAFLLFFSFLITTFSITILNFLENPNITCLNSLNNTFLYE